MTRTPPTDDATGSGERASGRGGNALVLASAARMARRTLASVTGVDPAASNAIAVTYGDAESWLNRWYEAVGTPTASVAVLSPGEVARSAGTASATTHSLPGWGTVDAIGDPGDLAAIGRRLRDYLDDWERRPQATLVTFESVGALLDRFGLRTTFRFLHLVCYEVNRVDASGWFYLDPAARDEVTVRTLAPLFDSVVARRDGEWTAERA